jgi:predicted XRE-type DNA-binding protein
MKKAMSKKRDIHTGARLADVLAADGILKDAESAAVARVIEFSSGNVFKDLNLPDAELRQARVQLAVAINRELATREWSQVQAAEVLGINQPKVSALQKYRLEGFSVERLMLFLTALGNDVAISIKRRARGAGRISVEAA